MNKQGLVPVKRLVVRNGKTFQQTVYIKPKHENKVDKTKKVQVPDWKFSTEDDFKKEIDRINNLRDRSERQVLKENLLDHIENKMGVNWKKVPDSEERAFVRNTMRAFSAAKKHLKANPISNTQNTTQNATQKVSNGGQNASSILTVTKQPGKDYVMERDTSKKLARDIRDKYGNDKIEQICRDNGITWNEVPDVGPNRMRALRALASFIRKGGELGESNNQANQQKLVIANPNEPLAKKQKSKYEEGSIQRDYELAKSHHKLIGLATGIMPVDEETAKYLEGLMLSGKVGLLENSEEEDYKLPKAITEMLSEHKNEIQRSSGYRKFERLNLELLEENIPYRYKKPVYDDVFATFENSKYKEEFNKLKENYRNFKQKWGDTYYPYWGTTAAENSKKLVGKLNTIDSNWQDKTCRQLYKNLGDSFKKVSHSEAESLWEELQIEDCVERSRFIQKTGTAPFGDILFSCTSGGGGIRQRLNSVATQLGLSNSIVGGSVDLINAVKNGKVSKQKVFNSLGETMTSNLTMYTTNSTVGDYVSSRFRIDGFDLFHHELTEAKRNNGHFDSAKFMKKADEITADMAPLTTPEASHIGYNLSLLTEVRNTFYFNQNLKKPDKLELVSFEDYATSGDLMHLSKVHIGAMRQKTEKAKQKYVEKFKNKAKNFSKEAQDALDDAIPFEQASAKLKFPDASEVKDIIKTTLMKVPESEAKVIEAKVHETHDKLNHASFKTKVHGVYRIKRIASEEKFQKINDDIDNTGYYYHGTSFDSSQKILGQSGGFKVFKESDKIKAGSMLGYGIYLAKESSKSMQYVGNGFRKGSRGVLFLCKASLGNVETSTIRGFSHNQILMSKDTTDTVFMDRPNVINPEWAVKRAEQAVPRLWIDAERT